MLKIKILLISCVVMLPVLAFAQPQIEISSKVEKEISVEDNGKIVVKRVIAEDADPGSVLFYSFNYQNSGNESARNVVIVDSVPENTIYVAGSARGAGAEITFSIDAGKHYKKPALLTYEIRESDGSTRKDSASPEQYTHIRWIISNIPAGAEGEVSFQVEVK